MNSLQIYGITDIKNIITNYQKQFEKIDKLEKELNSGELEIEFLIGMKEYKLKITDFETDLYLSGEKIADKTRFQSHYQLEEGLSHSILQYIAKKLINRYCILPFDEPYYFDCLDSILNDIFGNESPNLIIIVEQQILSGYTNQCEDQLIHLKYDRNFFYTISEFLDDEEPYMVRDCWYHILNFFNNFRV